MEILRINQISKRYQNKPLLDQVSLSLHSKETICLLGPSGGGKSTLLRIIAGLETPDRGQIYWQDRDITEKEAHLRKFGLMFQDYALFPHMNVFDNIAFGLRMQNLEPDEINARTMRTLELVHMKKFAERNVTDLSGGEQQRVALARTLAPEPHLIMLDEPLGALDRTLRTKLSDELRYLLQQIDIPVIYVTHDQDEAFAIADRILVLHEGHIIQSGKPSDVYSQPISLWLASFFGLQNHIAGEVIQVNPNYVKTDIGVFEIRCGDSEFRKGEKVILVLKPTEAGIGSVENRLNSFNAKVIENIFQADRYKVNMLINDRIQLSFYFTRPFSENDQLTINMATENILCYRS